MDNDGYFSDIAFFKKYNEYVDSYQNSNPKIYFFLKDCGFQRFYHENKNSFPDDETKNMCNKFQLEMMKYQYNTSMVYTNQRTGCTLPSIRRSTYCFGICKG